MQLIINDDPIIQFHIIGYESHIIKENDLLI